MTVDERTPRFAITRRLVICAIAAIAIASQWHTFLGAVQRLGDLRPAWLAGAIAAEVASFVLAAELSHQLLRSAGVPIRRSFFVALTYAGAALSRAVPAGGAMSIGYTYRRLVRRGVTSGLAAWLLVASGVISMSALVTLGVVGAWLRGITVASSVLTALVALAVTAGVFATLTTLATASRSGSLLPRLVQRTSELIDRMSRPFARRRPRASSTTFNGAIDIAFSGWLRAFSLSAANWFADLATIGLTFIALGVRLPWSSLLWAYIVIQVLVSIPLLGCIGIAETSMTVALVCIGVKPTPALAIVLVYRMLNFWLVLPIGWLGARNLAHTESAAGCANTSRSSPAPPKAVDATVQRIRRHLAAELA